MKYDDIMVHDLAQAVIGYVLTVDDGLRRFVRHWQGQRDCLERLIVLNQQNATALAKVLTDYVSDS